MSLTEEDLKFIEFILDLAYDHGFLEDPEEIDRLYNLIKKVESEINHISKEIE